MVSLCRSDTILLLLINTVRPSSGVSFRALLPFATIPYRHPSKAFGTFAGYPLSHFALIHGTERRQPKLNASERPKPFYRLVFLHKSPSFLLEQIVSYASQNCKWHLRFVNFLLHLVTTKKFLFRHDFDNHVQNQLEFVHFFRSNFFHDFLFHLRNIPHTSDM